MSESTEAVVLVEVADRVAVVTMNRPEARNAVNRAVRVRLPTVLAEVEAREDVDVAILTGADPAFCAGVDLKEVAAGDRLDPPEPGTMDIGRRDASGQLPFRGPFPPRSKLLIGAINGVAITGGFELALGCDFLVASDRARFADTHARVGVMPGWGLTVMLSQAIGVRRAKEMSATGNFMDAEEALACGLVNHVVPHAQLLDAARSIARDIVSNDQLGVRCIVRTYNEVTATTVEEAWDIEDRVSRDWEGPGFDPASIEARRQEVFQRGRAQLSGDT